MILLISATLLIVVGTAIGVAIDQADSRRSEEFDRLMQIYGR